MIDAIFSRRVRDQTSAFSTILHCGVAPPTRRSHDSSILQSLLRFLPGDGDPWAGGGSKAQALLPRLRQDFRHCVADLDERCEGMPELLRSIQRCRSLRDFWHLRTAVYTQVARAHSQWEAEQRLAQLNRHFPLKPAAAGPQRPR